MKPTRVIYDGLAKGTHTWIFAEGPSDDAFCAEHGVVQRLKSNADGSPRKELVKKCPVAGADGGCGKPVTRQVGVTIVDRPNVYAGDILEVADLNDPNSHRATLIRDAIARGLARVLKDGETAPAPAPAP